MPAAIPFAFPNTMMPAATTAASAGAATAEGATDFGQLVDAAAQPQAGVSADAAMTAAGMLGAVVDEFPAAAAGTPQQPLAGPLVVDAEAAVIPPAAEALPDMAAAPELGQPIVAEEPAAPTSEPQDPELVAEAEPDLTSAEPRDALPMVDESLVIPERRVDAQNAPAQQAALDVPAEAPQQLPTDMVELLPTDAAPDDAVPAERAAAPIAAALAEAVQKPLQQTAAAQPETEQQDSAIDGPSLAPASRKVETQFALARMADAAAAAEAADLADVFEAAAPSSGKDNAPAPALTAMASAKPAPVEASLPAALLTQAISPMGQAPIAQGAHPYAASLAAVVPEPVVKAEPGRFGADVGMEIAKVAKGDGDSLFIRLDPRDMGRVDVRLSFDRDGVLRAVMSVDSPAALDMLRRESGELNRALTEAGVRSDGQSLRFDSRADGGAGQSGAQGGSQGDQARSGGGSGRGGQGEPSASDYQPLRSTTQVDLIA
jgi:flagellar hook-length control protein FliK